MLAVLALEQRPVSRDELGDAVWGTELPKTWETALRGAVRQIRQAVTQADPHRSEIVRTAFGCYQLDPEIVVDVVQAAGDVDAAERALAAGDPATALPAAERAATALAQPLLAGLDGEWLDEERRRLAPLHFRALLAVSAAGTAVGDHAQAVRAAVAAIELDPFLESAHRQLMAAHAAAGDRAAALFAYRRCREVLADELGLDPSEQTEAAHRSVVADLEPVAPLRLPGSLDVSLPMAGRVAELAKLREAWDDVAAGASRALVVVGAAGVGKSRLAAEAAAIAHGAGAAVVHGRFDPDDFGAFGAFAAAFGQLGVAWPPPELVGGAGGGLDRSVLFDGAVGVVAGAAEQRRLVVVLDDVHWADRPSLALLERLRTAGLAGVLILATSRDDWIQPALAELLEGADRLELGPLDADGVGELIGGWAGHRPNAHLLAEVEARTGGNPFFITAVLQHLASRGAVGLETGIAGVDALVSEVPETMAGLVDAAVERCGPAAREIATVAAILGDDFRADTVAAVTSRPIGATVAALERLVHVRLLGQAPNDPGRFRFVHALVRESLVAGIEDEEQRALHARAADALEVQADVGAGGVLRHLLAARRPESLPSAVERGLEAAHELVDRGAPDEAVRLLTELGDAIDEVGGVDRLQHGSVLAALAMAELAMDDLAAGREHLRAAARIAIELGDASVFLTGSNVLRPPSIGEVDDEMIELVEQLVDLTAPGSRLRAMLLSWLSVELASSDDSARASALGGDAVAIARSMQDAVLLRQTVLAWHLASRPFVPAVERRAAMEELLTLRSPLGKRAGDLVARVFIAGDCLELGDHASAAAHVASVLAESAGFGATHLRWLALRNTVLLRAMEGHLDEAEVVGAEAAAVAARLALPEAMLLQVLQLVVTRYHQGRLDELHPMIAAFAAGAPSPVPIPLVLTLAWIEAELGLESAPDRVDAAVEAVLTMPRFAAWAGLVAITVEAAAKVGHARTADVAALLEPWSGQHVVIVTIGYLGAVDRCLGLAAASVGDQDRARVLLRSALDQHRAIGATPYVARSEAELAALG